VWGWGRDPFSRNFMKPTPRRKWYLTTGRSFHEMVLDPIPQSLPVHFFGSRPQPPTSREECQSTWTGTPHSYNSMRFSITMHSLSARWTGTPHSYNSMRLALLYYMSFSITMHSLSGLAFLTHILALLTRNSMRFSITMHSLSGVVNKILGDNCT